MEPNNIFCIEEITRKPDESYKDAYYRLFNNFILHFPRGKTIGFYRLSNGLDSTDGDMSNMRFITDDYAQLYSEKWKNQTTRQFYTELDTTTERCGIPLVQVTKMIDEALEEGLASDEKESHFKVLFDTLTPIYEAMRRGGYNPFDLRG